MSSHIERLQAPAAHVFRDPRRIREQDPQTWIDIFNQFNGRLVRIGMSRGLSPTDAEDNAQETWVAIVRNLRRENFAFGPNTGAYIRIAAENKVINTVRKKEHRVTEVEDIADETMDMTGASPEESVMGEIIDRRLVDALQELNGVYRIVLILHSQIGLSNKEIAEFLGIPRGTVASRLKRGKDKMKKLLET